MIIKESAENYLEAIYMIDKRCGVVRSVDVAKELSVSKASVSVAMKSFREEGYITIDSDGNITLKAKGRRIAERVYERHEIIAKVLMLLGVDEKTAYLDSCKIEHDISDKSFDAIKKYLTDVL